MARSSISSRAVASKKLTRKLQGPTSETHGRREYIKAHSRAAPVLRQKRSRDRRTPGLWSPARYLADQLRVSLLLRAAVACIRVAHGGRLSGVSPPRGAPAALYISRGWRCTGCVTCHRERAWIYTADAGRRTYRIFTPAPRFLARPLDDSAFLTRAGWLDAGREAAHTDTV